MLNRELQEKLNKLIKEKFNIIFEYDFEGRVLLYGGAIRSTLLKERINDLDFVILTQGKCQILDFIKKYNLKYRYNIAGGYKIIYEDLEIDIYSADDLYYIGKYNIDKLFYDIKNHIFISCGYIDALKHRRIVENSIKLPFIFTYEKKRLKKLINYVKTITKSSKRVKVKRNIFYWKYLKIRREISRIRNSFKNGNFRKCFRFLDGRKKEFGIIIFLGMLLTIISIFTPTLSGNLITKILYGGYNTVITVIALLVFLKIISILLSFYISKLYLVIKKKMIFNIRKELFRSVLNFEMENFNNNNSGNFINKIKDDPNDIVRTFNGIKDVLIKGIGNVGVLLYIFYLNFSIGLILLAFMFLVYKIKMIGIKKRLKSRKEFLKEQEKSASLLGEMINGISDIKTLNLKDNYTTKTTISFQNALESEYNGDYSYSIYNKISSFVEFVAIGIIIVYGVILIKLNLLAPSTLIIIYMYKVNVFEFLNKLTYLMSLRADFNLSCNRIFSLLDDSKFTKESYGNKEKKECLGLIKFDNVNFKYDKTFVLNKCSFKVGQGETIAIVGKSGSGKTTILNLITKMYKANSGNVFIDNININELSETYIRDNISIISQNPYLFDMSIKENLKLVNDNITDEEIIEICKKVCIHDFINKLPNKYDTIIGEGGLKLSGGQKQRLGIARALVKNTKIILLDEITSALDNETGAIIKKVIKNIQKEHTIIIVTHELSMIKDCSRILVLEEGKIIDEGTHNDLIKKSKNYKKLYKLK